MNHFQGGYDGVPLATAPATNSPICIKLNGQPLDYLFTATNDVLASSIDKIQIRLGDFSDSDNSLTWNDVGHTGMNFAGFISDGDVLLINEAGDAQNNGIYTVADMDDSGSYPVITFVENTIDDET